MTPTYLDFELEIGERSNHDYPVAVLRSPAGEARATVRLPLDQQALDRRLADLQLAPLGSGEARPSGLSSEMQAARDLGSALFDALFVGEVRSRFDVSLQQAISQGMGLRIKLRAHPPEMAALPWEFLYDSRQGEYLCLVRNTPLVRYLELPRAIRPLAVTPPLRILGIVASPSDLARLDVDQERQRIEQATQDLRRQGLLELAWLPGQSWSELQAALRKGPWHILHFSGHGVFDQAGETGSVFFAGENGHSQAISADQLGRLLSNHDQLRLVWLNSCEGARGSQLKIFSGTASLLVQRGIPAVVAMQYEITDQAAIHLARAFYEAITDGFPVDSALAEARVAVSLSMPNTLEWGTPVLYMRTPDGRLFDLHSTPASLKSKSASRSVPRPATARAPATTRPKSYARSDSTEFRTHAEELMRQGKRLILIGVGLNILQRDPFAMEIMGRAAAGQCELEVYLADPTSPAIEARLIEEELGDMKPPVGRAGLVKRVTTFLGLWESLGRPGSVRIRLFSHYPTFALIVIDDEYFVYPYGYATLGNFSPVFCFSRSAREDQDVIAFLEHQVDMVKANALDADLVWNTRIRHEPPASVQSLRRFALYFIPPADSELYQFGSKVLGYDIRKTKVLPSPFADQVGSAHEFGFHLTLCDALYFFGDAEIRSAVAEIEFLAEEFRGFELRDLRIVRGFPDDRSLAIVPGDPTGSLEALHSELVHRVYRRSAASNYSLGLALPSRDPEYERARRMIRRYRAPYILQRFRPHFTLLTQVPPQQMEVVGDHLQQMFLDEAVSTSIRVEKLAVMSRPQPAEPWRISKEIELG